MKIRITEDFQHGEKRHVKGTVLEVDIKIADKFIGERLAVEHVEEKGEQKGSKDAEK